MRAVLQPDGTIGWVMDPPEEDPFTAVSPGMAFTDGQGTQLLEDQLPPPPDYPPAAPAFETALPEPAPAPAPIAETPSPFSGLIGKAKDWASGLFDYNSKVKEEAKSTLAAEIERRKQGLQAPDPPVGGIMGESWGLMDPQQRHEWLAASRAGNIAEQAAMRDLAARNAQAPMARRGAGNAAATFPQARLGHLQQEGKRFEDMAAGRLPLAQKTGLRSGVENFIQGGINDIGAGTVETAGIIQGYLMEGAANYGQSMGIGDGINNPEDTTLYQLGNSLRRWTETAFPGDLQRQDEVMQQVSRGAAQIISLYGTGAALKILGAGDKVMAGVSAGMGIGMEAPIGFNEATQVMDDERKRLENENGPRPYLGPSEMQRFLATVGYGAAGATEMIPFMKDFSAGVPAALKLPSKMAEGAIEEGGQEMFQTGLENAASKLTYDPQRDLGEGMDDAGLIASILGAGGGAGRHLGDRFAERRQKGAIPPPPPPPPPPSGGGDSRLHEDAGITFEDRPEEETPAPDRIQEPTLETGETPPPVRIAQDEERPTTPIGEVLGKARERRDWRAAGNAVTEYPPPSKGGDQGDSIPQDEFANLIRISQDVYNQPPISYQSRMAPAKASGPTGSSKEANARPEPPLGQDGAIKQTWGPKWDRLMGQEYRKAEAGSDLSTQRDILLAKLSKTSDTSPEMRTAMEARVRQLEEEMGPEGRAAVGIEEKGDGTRRAPISIAAPDDTKPLASLVQEPSEAQQKAGNYQKGHVKVQGLDISVETPKGGTRRGPGWEVQMPGHYGYIKRTLGKDGDHVDVTIGDNPEAPNVTIIDQKNPKTGKFDEHKTFVGFNSEADAVETYRKSFSGDFARNTIGPTRTVPMEEFKSWLRDGDTTKPFSPKGETPSLSSDAEPAGKKQADREGFDTSKVWYHKTSADFETFKPYSHFGSADQANMRGVSGDARVIPVYAKSQNLKRERDTGDWSQKKLKKLERQGYDGVVYLNRYEGIPLEAFERATKAAGGTEKLDALSDREFRKLVPEAKDSIIVFDPKSVRPTSQTDNRIEPSGASPDKLESRAIEAELTSEERKKRAEAMGFDTSRVWYHGTTHTIEAFNPKKGNIESHLGHAVYLTSEPDDASDNYAGLGPDLTNRIERLAEQIEPDIDEDELPEGVTTYERAKEMARDKLQGDHEGAVIPVYARKDMNILNLDKDFMDLSGSYDEENDDYADSENAIKLRDALDRAPFDGVDVDKVMADLADAGAFSDGDISAREFDSILRKSEGLIYAQDDNGDLVSSEIIRRVYEALGYDAVEIDASSTFERMNMPDETRHLMVFDPANTRSVNASFDPERSKENNLLAMRATDKAKGRKSDPRDTLDSYGDPMPKKGREESPKQRRHIESLFESMGFRSVKISPKDHGPAYRLYDEIIEVARLLKVPPSVFSGGGVLSLDMSKSTGIGKEMTDTRTDKRVIVRKPGYRGFYDPVRNSINLSPDIPAAEQASTFFHEWFHFLDNASFVGQSRTNRIGMMTSGMDGGFARPEVRQAIDHLMNTIFGSVEVGNGIRRLTGMNAHLQALRQRHADWTQNVNDWLMSVPDGDFLSRQDELNERLKKRYDALDAMQRKIDALDREKGKKLSELETEANKPGKTTSFYRASLSVQPASAAQYFASPWELAARAFQLHLAVRSSRSDIFEVLHGLHADKRAPYPLDSMDDSIEISNAFKNLFDTLKTRPGRRGYELYALGRADQTRPVRGLYNPLIRAVQKLQIAKPKPSKPKTSALDEAKLKDKYKQGRTSIAEIERDLDRGHSPEQWLNTLFEKDQAGNLRPKGSVLKDVRSEVVDWSGLIPWLEERAAVLKESGEKVNITKRQVIAFLKAHDIEIEEVWNDEGDRPPRPEPPKMPPGSNLKGIKTPEQKMKEWEESQTEEYTIEIDDGEVVEPDESYLRESAEDRLEDIYGFWSSDQEDLIETAADYGIEPEDIEQWVLDGADTITKRDSLKRSNAGMTSRQAQERMAREEMGPAASEDDIVHKADEIGAQIIYYEGLLDRAIRDERSWYYEQPDIDYTVTITQGDQEWTESVRQDSGGGGYYWSDDPSGRHEYSLPDRLKAAIEKKYLDAGHIKEPIDEIDDNEREKMEALFRKEFDELMEKNKDVVTAEYARYAKEKAEYDVAKAKWDDEMDALAALGRTKHLQYTPSPKVAQRDYFELKVMMPGLDGNFVVTSHFNRNNIIVHGRFGIRHQKLGDKTLKILEVQEVQGDLNQEGERRKKKGKKNAFQGIGDVEARNQRLRMIPLRRLEIRDELSKELPQSLVNDITTHPEIYADPEKQSEMFEKSAFEPAFDDPWTKDRDEIARRYGKQAKELLDLNAEEVDLKGQDSEIVPPNPFRQEGSKFGGTPAYVQVMLKRILRWAVDNNFDAITWTTGAQQAAIYGRGEPAGRLIYRWVDGKLDVHYAHAPSGETGIKRFKSIKKPIPEAEARQLFGDRLVDVMKARYGDIGEVRPAGGKADTLDDVSPEDMTTDQLAAALADPTDLRFEPIEWEPATPLLGSGPYPVSVKEVYGKEISIEPRETIEQWEMFDADKLANHWRSIDTNDWDSPKSLPSAGMHLQYDLQFHRFWNAYLKPWGGKVESIKLSDYRGGQQDRVRRPRSDEEWENLILTVSDRTARPHYPNMLRAARDNPDLPMPRLPVGAADLVPSLKETIYPHAVTSPIIYLNNKMREDVRKGQPFYVGTSAYEVQPAVDITEVAASIRKMIPADWKVAEERGRKVGAEDVLARVSSDSKTIFVALNSDNPKLYAKHEVVHVLREIDAIPEKDWKLLREEARTRGWRQTYKIDERYGDDYADKFPDPDIHEEMLDEEAIGHAFMNNEADSGGILAAIRRVLARIRNALKGLGFKTAEDVFRKIESGAYLDGAKPSVRGAPNLYLLGDEFKDGYMAISAEAKQALNDRAKLALSRASTLGEKWRMWKDLKGAQAGLALQKTRLGYQDYFLGFKRLEQAAARQHGVQLSDEAKPYLAEELFHKQQEYQIEKFNDEKVDPFVLELAKAKSDGVTLDDLEIYLYARHAQERNEQIAKINPPMPDGGSGMTTENAKEILKQYANDKRAQARLDSLAAKIDEMNRSKLDMLVDNGLMTVEARKAMRDKYTFYVPLKGLDTPGPLTTVRGLPQGFSVRNHGIKRALGRKSAAQDIVSRVLVDYYETVVRVEKNRVGQALYKMLKEHPMEHIAVVDTPKMVRYLSKTSGLEVEVPTGEDSDNPVIQKELVKSRPDPLAFVDPNTVSVMVDGKRHHIRFLNQDLADAFRNISGQQYPLILQWLRNLNRIYALLLTSLNPEFQVPNFTRDVQAAGINMASEDVKKGVRKLVSYAPKAMKGILLWNVDRNSTDEWAKVYDDLQKQGGTTGFYTLKDWPTTTEELKREIATAQMKSWRWGKVRKLLTKMASAINDTMENSTRVAAYKIALDNGATKKQAASFAKNITVNFNRHGSNRWLGFMYIFANPNIQGNVRFLQAMLYGKNGRKIAAGMIGMGAIITAWNILAGAAMGGDDEENLYVQIPDYVRENNIIIMTPVEIPGVTKRIEGLNGRYINRIMIPMPYGYSLLYNLGRRGTETSMSWMTDWSGPPRDPAWEMVSFLGDIKGAFSPVGTHEHPMVEVTPTVLRPFAEIGFNEDFTGSEIVPPEFKPEMPDFHRVKRGTSPVFRDMAEWLNDVTGGDIEHPGWIDWSPESIKHVAEFSGGGAGKFTLRSWYLAEKFLNGEPIHFQDIPMFRRFAGGDAGMYYSEKYYEADTLMSQYDNTRRAAAKGSEPDKALLPTLELEKRVFPEWKAAEARLKAIRTKQKNLDAKQEEGTISKALYDKENNALWDQRQIEQMRFLKTYRIEAKRIAVEKGPWTAEEKSKRLGALAGEERRAKRAFEEMMGDARSEKDTRVPSNYTIDWGKLFHFSAP